MRDKILWLGMMVLLVLIPWNTQAQEPNPNPPVNAAPAPQEDEPSGQDALSLEFLEFLGDWEIEEGKWIDPAEWEVPLPEQETYDEENEPKEN